MYLGHLILILEICCVHLLVSCMNSKEPDFKENTDKLPLFEITGANDIQVYAVGIPPRSLNPRVIAVPVEIDPLPEPNLPRTRFTWYDHSVVLHGAFIPFVLRAILFQPPPLIINHDILGLTGDSDDTSRTRDNAYYNTESIFNRSHVATICNQIVRRWRNNTGRNNADFTSLKHVSTAVNQSEVGVPTLLSQDGAATNNPTIHVSADELTYAASPTFREAVGLVSSSRGDETSEVLFDLSMSNEENRLGTYELWPHAFVSPTEMARSGFYFINLDDIVRCFCCGIDLGHWQQGDDPIAEHRRLSPHCPYLCQLLHEKDRDFHPGAFQPPNVEEAATNRTANGLIYAQVCRANDTQGEVVTSLSRTGLGLASNRDRHERSNASNSGPVSTVNIGQPVTLSRTDRIEIILESHVAHNVILEGYSRAQVAEAVHSLIEGGRILEFELTGDLLRGTLMSMGIRPSHRRNAFDERLPEEDNLN